MPISQLVALLLLLVPQLDASSPHPLHAALDDILLTGRWCTYKYHDKMPRILDEPPGNELESQFMHFSLKYHRTDAELPGADDSAVDDRSLRQSWLDKLEKRE